VQEAIRTAAADVLAGYPRVPADSAQVLPRQGLALDVGGDFFFELAVGPLRGAEGEVDWAIAFALDRSRERRLQEKINAIDAAGRELVRLDADAINRREVPERLQLLQEKILKYCHELLKFDHLVIRVLDRRANRLETVVAGGLSEEAQSLEIYASPEGNGISGYVAATGRSYICDDILKDPRYLPGLEQARSSLTVPLWLNDQIVGTFNVESDKPASFTEDDRQMAEIFGRYIAIALHMLQLLVVERHTTAGQLAADVAAELSVPLNEIVAETQHLLERCADQGGLRQGLEAILRNVGRAREVLSSISEGAPLAGLAPPPPSRDPLLAGKRVLVADD
jgi:transcriptional regulator with GAF, ATPase, and Fis domain